MARKDRHTAKSTISSSAQEIAPFSKRWLNVPSTFESQTTMNITFRTLLGHCGVIEQWPPRGKIARFDFVPTCPM